METTPPRLDLDPSHVINSSPITVTLQDDGSPDLVVSPPPLFTHTLGAWAKPLHFSPQVTPPEPISPRDFESETHGDSSNWPSLNHGSRQDRKRQPTAAVNIFPNLPVNKLPPPVRKEDGSLRFPWAANMNPVTRNLYRAADPTFRLDGTPQITIPSKVLLLGPENQEEYVVGKFHRCSSPSGGLVHAVVNRLWGRICKVSCKKLGESSYLFHIPHAGTRDWVLQRAIWHIDDCLMFVAPWCPASSFTVPEISTIPVWVNLKKIPDRVYSRLGISHIASGLGEPMLTHKPRLDPTSMGESKILVEVELDKPFPRVIALDDKKGNIFLVEVEYTWIPSTCGRCGHLGHKEKRCLMPPPASDSENIPQPASASENIQKPDLGSNVTVESPSTKENQIESQELNTHQVQMEGESPKQVSPAHMLQKVAAQLESITPFALSCQHEGDKHFQEETLSQEASDNTHVRDTITLSPKPQEVTLLSTTTTSTLEPILAVSITAQNSLSTMEPTPSTILENSQEFPRTGPLLDAALVTNTSYHTPSQSKNPFDEQVVEVEGEGGSEYQCYETLETLSNTTRGGRIIKPTQKLQEMEWTCVGGRGKRGRRGRGSHIN